MRRIFITFSLLLAMATALGADYYVTGSFTSWDTPGGAGTFRLTPDDDSIYRGIVCLHNSTTQPTRFKIGAAGSWDCFGAVTPEPHAAPFDALSLASPNDTVVEDIHVNAPNGSYRLAFNPARRTLSMTPYPCDKREAVMFTGNSICDFWDNTDPEFFAANGFSDSGISGQVSSQILARFDSEVLLENPSIVVIIAPTTNDIALNDGYADHEGQIANVRRMIEKAQNRGATVVLTSNLPCNYCFWRPQLRPGREVVEVNGLLANLAAEMGVVYVDLHTPMRDADEALHPSFTEDGAHPNAAGYAVMKSILLPVVDSLRR